jgi:uncharacterized protein (TIGR03663 family)
LPGRRVEPGPEVPVPPETAPASSLAADDRLATAGPDLFDRLFLPAALGILLVAAALRLPELALNPFHHDEGVNGFFTTNLVRTGKYVYDPANYHGPSLYYFALASEILFGLTTEAMRLVPVLFGMLMVGLVFPLRRYLGALAVLTAGGLLAISPGAVYVSRYFIHETLLVSLTLAVVVATVFYLDRREPKYLLAGAVALALLFATKETGIITIAVLLIAVAVGHLYVSRRRPPSSRAKAGRPASRRRSVWIDGVEYRPATTDGPNGGPSAALPRAGIPGEQLAAAAVVFGVIYVLLYSSFFSNFPKGLIDSLATFTIWAGHGEATQVQPLDKYLRWMFPTEAPILVLGAIGGVIAAIYAPNRLWVVIALWAAGITAAYSIIQYKTPWIILNMLLPLALLAGLAVSEMWRSRRLRLGVPVVLGAAVLISGYQAIDLNYRHYDDETYPYVFVHSTRDMLNLVDEIKATAERAGTGKETGVVFVTPDYWPLPWYFNDYPRAGFFGSIVETKEAMIVANVNQEAELAPSIEGRYDRVGTYNLRPGVDLALYVRNDVPKE